MRTERTETERHAALWCLRDTLLTRLLTNLDPAAPEPPTASMLSVARAFLSDNGIVANGKTDLRGGLAMLKSKPDFPFNH